VVVGWAIIELLCPTWLWEEPSLNYSIQRGCGRSHHWITLSNMVVGGAFIKLLDRTWLWERPFLSYSNVVVVGAIIKLLCVHWLWEWPYLSYSNLVARETVIGLLNRVNTIYKHRKAVCTQVSRPLTQVHSNIWDWFIIFIFIFVHSRIYVLENNSVW